MQLRNQTSHLKGDEKFIAMREMANEVYDALTEAVDEVEKDTLFNPREFLGIVLQPEQIFAWATTLFTLGLGLLQSNLDDAKEAAGVS